MRSRAEISNGFVFCERTIRDGTKREIRVLYVFLYLIICYFRILNCLIRLTDIAKVKQRVLSRAFISSWRSFVRERSEIEQKDTCKSCK